MIKQKLISFKHYMLKAKAVKFLAFGALALSPIAIAAGCGESSNSSEAEPTVLPTTPLGEFASLVREGTKVTAVSTHNDVHWSQLVPALPDELSNVYDAPVFSTVKFAKQAAASESALETWSATLPTEVEIDANDRSLWMRFEPKISPTTDSTAQLLVVNLTQSSEIKTVRVNIEALPTFYNYYLENVALSGSTAALEVTNTTFDSELQKYMHVEFKALDSAWLDETSFKTFVKNQSSTLVREQENTFFVRFNAIDKAKAILSFVERKISLDDVTFLAESPKPAIFYNWKKVIEDNDVKFNNGSSQPLVGWNVYVPQMSAADLALYYEPEYTYSLNGKWSTSLPGNMVDSYDNLDYAIWLRIRPRNESTETPTLLMNVGYLFKARDIPIKLDFTRDYKLFFNNEVVKFTGTLADVKIDERMNYFLRRYMKFEYYFNEDTDQTWERDEFIKFLSTVALPFYKNQIRGRAVTRNPKLAYMTERELYISVSDLIA